MTNPFGGVQAFDLNIVPNCEEEDDINRVASRERFQEIDLNVGVFDLNTSPDYEDEDDEEVDFHTYFPEAIPTNNGEDVQQSAAHSNVRRLNFLCNNDRHAVYNMLLQQSVNGRLKNGVTNMVAAHFYVSGSTVRRIWRQGRGNENGDASHRKISCGRKRIQLNPDQIREIPIRHRTTLRSLACATDISKSTVHRLLKAGSIRRHSNAIKPSLKEENKKARMLYCISMLEDGSLPHDPTFKGMYNVIHIDEKWFFMTDKVENYYLLQDEEDPVRTCKNKNYIERVMFLVAIARPRFDPQGNETFSGKIGVFPFITQVPAKRSSVNRVAGTLETKPMTSINRDVIRSFLIESVLPAIKEKWPRDELESLIIIQQDNARPHIDHNDKEFHLAAREMGLNIHLVCQPPNSPDLNVLDLGFFSAIQSLQYKERPKTINELVSAVQRSYDAFSTVKSNRIFLSFQLCMIEIMKIKGSNNYKIPHINKERLEREGILPAQMKCDAELVEEVRQFLS